MPCILGVCFSPCWSCSSLEAPESRRCEDSLWLFQLTFISQHVKIKHDVKARLTHSSTGASGGEGPRSYIQVLANSGMGSLLVYLHYRQLLARGQTGEASPACWPYGGDLLVVGIVRYDTVCPKLLLDLEH